MEDRVLQFEIWNECNNNCKFCSNKFVYNITDEEKLKNIDIVINRIKNEDIIGKYQRIGFIGGEFFQGQLRNQKVKNRFFELVDISNDLLENNGFNQVWFTATLISENQDDLWLTIDRISQKNKIWICTSYDTIGRFHTDKLLNQWKYNMKEIKRRYPEVNINVTSILTEDFIKKYLSGEFNLKNMLKEFDCTWYFKPPMIPSECSISKKEFNDKTLNGFFPKRKDFLDFMRVFKKNESKEYYDRLFDTHLRADELIKANYNNEDERMVILRKKETSEEITQGVKNDNFVKNVSKIEHENNDTNKESMCKHNKSYSPYVDSDKCFYCDKEMMASV